MLNILPYPGYAMFTTQLIGQRPKLTIASLKAEVNNSTVK